jgi:hypothetical protein
LDVGLRAVCVVDSLRSPNVDVDLRADFSCRFWKPPHTGEVLPKFSTSSDVFVALQSRTCRRGPRSPRRP